MSLNECLQFHVAPASTDVTTAEADSLQCTDSCLIKSPFDPKIRGSELRILRKEFSTGVRFAIDDQGWYGLGDDTKTMGLLRPF